VVAYEETFRIDECLDNLADAAVCAFNLGNAHKDISAVRDLGKAEHWYRQSLELFDERDRLGRGNCHRQLGVLAFERFLESRSAGRSEAEMLGYVNAAGASCHEALDLLPSTAVNELAFTHFKLGIIYHAVGNIDRALSHYREAIHRYENVGDVYRAADTQSYIAAALADTGRVADAREYARAALRSFETYGAGAAEMIQRTQQLLANLGDAPQ
jgi:tetratricopeptide (TPR) repeat protein